MALETYVVEGLSYQDAKKLVEELKEAGLYAHISVGCLQFQTDDLPKAEAICQKYGVKPKQGNRSALAQRTLAERPFDHRED